MYDGRPTKDNERQATMRIGRVRKDGLFPVTFQYFSSGRTLRKLYNIAQIEDCLKNGGYNVIR